MPNLQVIGADLAKVFTSEEYLLGSVYEDGYGRRYQFVYIDDDVDAVAGGILIAADDTVKDHAVTADITGGSCIVYAGTNTNMHVHAGLCPVACDVSASERYVWLQQTGRNATAIITDGNAAAGRGLVMTADGGGVGLDTTETDADPMFNGHRVGAFATDADDSTTLAVGDAILTCELI